MHNSLLQRAGYRQFSNATGVSFANPDNIAAVKFCGEQSRQSQLERPGRSRIQGWIFLTPHPGMDISGRHIQSWIFWQPDSGVIIPIYRHGHELKGIYSFHCYDRIPVICFFFFSLNCILDMVFNSRVKTIHCSRHRVKLCYIS